MDTWSTLHQYRRWHLIYTLLTTQISRQWTNFQSIHMSCLILGQLLTDCWSIVDRVSIGFLTEYQSRVSIDTWLQVPISNWSLIIFSLQREWGLQWVTKVLRHFAILEYLRQISFLISKILPPPPFSMLDFLPLEFASFLYNIEKGEGD